ncbi:NAD(P)/FAD-dependent oxidoreductase [Clostridium sp. BJN0001]|uniref:NAD(P)/FAD-dependent oxidoreductase n=1 Tax=Clostridium sp. BJN0001 TaxID=2930219 RepID=UPI001FD23179|nr:NAD(P)/FAD-dependent oxidoreductase [Clostridium sp. BJN0001]
MENRLDAIIIGSGPAGISAALNLKIRRKNFMIFGNDKLSLKLDKAEQINNYLGFPGIKGSDLRDKFKKHIEDMEIKITKEKIISIYSMGDYFVVNSDKNNMYESETIILAVGVEYIKPIEGEEEYLGKGVGYCTTCDGPLYRDKTVSIIAYNSDGEKDASYINEIAKKVYYIPMYRGELNLDDNINVIRDKPIKIEGKEKVEKIILKENNIETDGVFLVKDAISPKDLVPGLKMDGNHIEVNRKMETSIIGCFAAGDCTGFPYQYIKAAGEGNIASLSAVKYLDNKK